jgi:type VI secretion system protein ImpJ
MNAVVDSLPQVPEAVSWSEGMLLSPQHFQQNDIYWNALLRHQLSVLQPYCWGVLELSVDPVALVKGVVVIERLHAVMNDGLVIDYPGNFGTQPLTLDLSKHPWDTEPTVIVQLRVPVRGKGAASANSDMQRYTTEHGNLEADENTGKDDIIVDRIRPKMTLAAGTVMAKCYCSFPLLELVGDSRGFHFTTYHPPMLRLGASVFQAELALAEKLKALSVALWAKYRELMGWRVDGRDAPRHGREANPHALAARHLVMALPAFDVMLKSGTAHPYDLYLALSQLVGMVAATAGAAQPPALAGYDHANCMPQFQQALDYIQTQLARLSADFDVIDFRHVGASGFMCHLPSGTATNRLLIELRPRSGQNAATLGTWIDSARIAADDLMSTLVKRRYPGAVVTVATPAQVAELNLQPGAFVYEIANGSIEPDAGAARALIVAGRTLVILGEPDENVPAAITLYLPHARPPVASAGAA